MAKISVAMEVGSDGVGVITLSHPPVNALAFPVLEGLKMRFDEAMQRDDVKAIVVTGASGKFSAGFDITAFKAVQDSGDTTMSGKVAIELMTHTVEEARKPSVAAIDGLALGGGLELAMACTARISTPKAQLGLPELQLGIIPGFGGTQRLPRLVGLSKAIEMMLLSKPISAEEGHKLGLVDSLSSQEDLLTTGRKWALDIAEGRKPWVLSLRRTDKLEPLSEAREIIKFARAQVKKTAPNLQHPVICLDAIEEGVVKGGYAGALKEGQGFTEAVAADTAKALMNVFFAQRSTAKIAGITDLGLKPRPMKRVAVIGGGLMGSGISTALILAGIPVVLKEVNDKFLQAGLGRIKSNLQSRVKKGKMTKEKMEKTFSLMKGTLDYSDFNSVDLVIEAVIENVDLKQSIFADLVKYTSPDCVLSTNTSTIDLNLVAAKTIAQDRVAGAHFFSPAHIMPLLEIIRTEKTSPQVLVDLLNLGKVIKKTPVVVGNTVGFGVNRVFFPYGMATAMLLDLGVDIYRMDAVIKAFGMPMGPFSLADLVGLDIALEVGKQHLTARPGRTYKSEFYPLLVKDGRLGQKSGKGIYVYDEKRRPKRDPEVMNYVKKAQEIANVMPGGKPLKITDQEIVEMHFFPVVNEAARLLEEGIFVKASDLDIATVMGMGFPPYRGGVAFWADLVGIKYIVSKLDKWTEMYGTFFKPCDFLVQRAASGAKLCDPVTKAETKSKL
ncbi:unnamed protein product [Calypogeia fissa]